MGMRVKERQFLFLFLMLLEIILFDESVPNDRNTSAIAPLIADWRQDIKGLIFANWGDG